MTTKNPAVHSLPRYPTGIRSVFARVDYKVLNARQKENRNFHKLAALLSEYGYNSIRLSDDWEGADFIAVHIDGEKMLRIQLKSALSIAKKYMGKNLHIGFIDGCDAYVFPHDLFVKQAEKLGKITHTVAWKKDGLFFMVPPPEWARKILARYRLTANPPKE